MNPDQSCNCDISVAKWLSDEGHYISPNSLGITQMVFLQQSDLDKDAQGRITLGPLECVETSRSTYINIYIILYLLFQKIQFITITTLMFFFYKISKLILIKLFSQIHRSMLSHSQPVSLIQKCLDGGRVTLLSASVPLGSEPSCCTNLRSDLIIHHLWLH